jgi:hypothetical protein
LRSCSSIFLIYWAARFAWFEARFGQYAQLSPYKWRSLLRRYEQIETGALGGVKAGKEMTPERGELPIALALPMQVMQRSPQPPLDPANLSQDGVPAGRCVQGPQCSDDKIGGLRAERGDLSFGHALFHPMRDLRDFIGRKIPDERQHVGAFMRGPRAAGLKAHLVNLALIVGFLARGCSGDRFPGRNVLP